MSLADDSAFAAAPTAEELAKLPLNDFGNAMRLIRLGGGQINGSDVDTKDCRLLYLMGQGWIGFNGKHWDLKYGEALARRLAHQVHLKMNNADMKALLITTHAVDAQRLTKFVDGLGDAGKTSAMLNQAQSYLTVEIDAFDQHPMAVNCLNGTLWMSADAKKGGVKCDLRGHTPSDRLTRMIACAYDKKATAPLFEGVVANSLRNEELRLCFQRYLGYGLTGHTYEQAFAMCQGKGQDGKSTILDAVRMTMGGHGEVGKVETFLDTGQQSASSAQPDLVKLAGDVRLVVLSEPPRGVRLNEGLIKAWTGGSPISARTLNAKPFDFRPVGKLTFECNALPVIKGDDHGIWRRVLIFLFMHQVKEEDIDRQLPKKLLGEMSGILNWLIAGVGDWLAQGLNPPEIVTKAKDDYRKQSSPFGDWLEERCDHGEAAGDAVTLTAVLYKDYKEWATDQDPDAKPMSVRAFGDALFQRQILHGPRANDGKKTRKPIRLKARAGGSSMAFTADDPRAASATQTPFDAPDAFNDLPEY